MSRGMDLERRIILTGDIMYIAPSTLNHREQFAEKKEYPRNIKGNTKAGNTLYYNYYQWLLNGKKSGPSVVLAIRGIYV